MMVHNTTCWNTLALGHLLCWQSHAQKISTYTNGGSKLCWEAWQIWENLVEKFVSCVYVFATQARQINRWTYTTDYLVPYCFIRIKRLTNLCSMLTLWANKTEEETERQYHKSTYQSQQCPAVHWQHATIVHTSRLQTQWMLASTEHLSTFLCFLSNYFLSDFALHAKGYDYFPFYQIGNSNNFFLWTMQVANCAVLLLCTALFCTALHYAESYCVTASSILSLSSV